ncbi:UDP-N-acetylmuramate dehydrogenase [Arcobacter sp. KX21116]|jgi:UDP-N-acetylmuramate dehydrogenase|uniref:UDP-N-acetylmuramate dehydrogenase n=1 Tax=Arcobacter iocasae TaxID=2906515 RepID=UPI0035D529A4|tara:strand:- start:1428 stop:2207 length:780 start_codon:yes stop_codon:yes gene_type:complete
MNNYTKSIDFSKYSSIHIGPTLEVLVINEIGDYSKYQIIGRANNLLISNHPPKFAVLGEEFDYIEQKEDKLYVGCATKSGKLLSYAKRNNLANFEFLGKLPGNLGGLIKMNAGLKEWEIFNYIDSIKTKDGYIKKEDVQYGYRNTNIDTIVYELVFNISSGYSKEMNELFTKMRNNQPQTPSAGSCFKNPIGDSAGRLIEQVGLKGFSKNGMSFSKVHANFLVNNGGGTFEDAIYLINIAKQRVKSEFNIDLQTEVIIF